MGGAIVMGQTLTGLCITLFAVLHALVPDSSRKISVFNLSIKTLAILALSSVIEVSFSIMEAKIRPS